MGIELLLHNLRTLHILNFHFGVKQEILLRNLLSQMSSDSKTPADTLDNLNDGELNAISRLANEAAALEKQVAAAEQVLKEKKMQLQDITDKKLPDALENIGLEKFTLKDGAEISIKPVYSISISEKNKPSAFTWLRENGYGDLIKDIVSINFGRGEDEKAKEFVELCELRGFVPGRTERVESMTMKGWLRERVEAGDPLPMTLLGAYISQRATIKRSK